MRHVSLSNRLSTVRSISPTAWLVVLTSTALFCAPSAQAGFPWFGKKSDACDTCDTCDDEGCEVSVTQPPVCDVPCQDIPCQSESCDLPCADGCCGQGCPSRGCGHYGEPKWHSPEWYAMRAHLPPGERPKCKHGKMTPVEVRPNLPEQPFWHRYHSTKNWPHPYDCIDRNNVRCVLATQTDRGWVNLATLHPHHFDVETGELNPSGIAKVTYVFTSLPPEHRTVYVSDTNPRVTPSRIAIVQASLIEIAGRADAMAVLPRTADNPSRPAVEVEQINRARLDNAPPPVIAYQGGGGTGGGGGGAGGGGGN